MKRLLATVTAVVLSVLSFSSQAYTPVSGFWTISGVPGSAITLQIEDKQLFMVAYIYDTQGRAVWYLSAGNLTSSTVNGQTVYNVFNGGLDLYANGPYLGGPAVQPVYFPNAGGPVQIIFNPADETRGTLSWAGKTYSIQQLDYYAAAYPSEPEVQRMIGEWTLTFDLYNRNGYSAYPFYGDLFVFDAIDRGPNPDQFIGCRPHNSLAGFCSTSAVQQHEAAGFYDAGRDEHVIVVTDALGNTNSSTTYFAYYLEVNQSDFEGVLEIYTGNETVGDGPYYPVRGFRSASRSFVLNGAGPNKTELDPKEANSVAASLAKAIRDSNGGALPSGLSAEEVKAKFGIDVQAHSHTVRTLQRSLESSEPRQIEALK